MLFYILHRAAQYLLRVFEHGQEHIGLFGWQVLSNHVLLAYCKYQFVEVYPTKTQKPVMNHINLRCFVALCMSL